MAELNYLDAATCQRWIDSHKKTYAVFHTWVEEQAHLATCRGWARNRQGRIRWVNEDNAKAQGASPARSAVNHLIQSLAADISKLALIKTLQAIEGTACKLIAMVHDEIIVAVPGECKLNLNKSKFDKKGFFIPKYTWAEESIHWAKVVQKCMEDAESEIFNFELPGKADFAIAPYWNH